MHSGRCLIPSSFVSTRHHNLTAHPVAHCVAHESLASVRPIPASFSRSSTELNQCLDIRHVNTSLGLCRPPRSVIMIAAGPSRVHPLPRADSRSRRRHRHPSSPPPHPSPRGKHPKPSAPAQPHVLPPSPPRSRREPSETPSLASGGIGKGWDEELVRLPSPLQRPSTNRVRFWAFVACSARIAQLHPRCLPKIRGWRP